MHDPCPFCALCASPEPNEFVYPVASLPSSELVLKANQHYQGYCLLIYRHSGPGPCPKSIAELDPLSWQQFAADLRSALCALRQACPADLYNAESLGNTIGHLHFHLIPRRLGDGRFGLPIWTSKLEDMPSRQACADELLQTAAKIRSCLQS